MTAAFIAKWIVIVLLGLGALSHVLLLAILRPPRPAVRRCILYIAFDSTLVALILTFWTA